jgi:hypothetical protein
VKCKITVRAVIGIKKRIHKRNENYKISGLLYVVDKAATAALGHSCKLKLKRLVIHLLLATRG